MPWPLSWSERLEGWRSGQTLRVDWASRQAGVAIGDVLQYREFPEPTVELGTPALVGPNRQGRLLAFSLRAVQCAMKAWEAFGIHLVYGIGWHVSWLNQRFPKGCLGVPANIGAWGLDVVQCGPSYLLFTPEVLGPIARILPASDGQWQWEWAQALSGRIGDRVLWIRAPQVLDGYWKAGRVEPVASQNGWMRLAVQWPDEWMGFVNDDIVTEG